MHDGENFGGDSGGKRPIHVANRCANELPRVSTLRHSDHDRRYAASVRSAAVRRKKLTVDFEGGNQSSNGGALLLLGGFIKRKRETGSVRPDKFGGYNTFALEYHTARVKELVAEQPDSTLAELQVRFAKETVNVSQSAISRFLHHINTTFNKKHTRGGTRSARRRRGP